MNSAPSTPRDFSATLYHEIDSPIDIGPNERYFERGREVFIVSS